MEKEIVLADILTAQEHNWIASSPVFTPTKEEEWYIPEGVLRRKITLEEANVERQAKVFVETMLDPLGIITRGTSEAMAISLEDIGAETGQTKNDPKILGIVDDESIEPRPVIDSTTGKVRNLTEELIECYREKGLEHELHLRAQPTQERENTSLGEGNAGSKI